MEPVLAILSLLIAANLAVLGAGATRAVVLTWRARERRPGRQRERFTD
ncbi:MAG: hypothetical protein ACLGIJ_01830 [Candidatus Limnocylindria bacterium]